MPEAVLLTASNVEELASICENELQKLRGDVAGAYFDEFEGKFKLQGKVALRGPRVGFVTAGGVDECIVRLEGAVKRLRKVGNTKTEWMLPKEKVWFSSRSRTGKVTALFSGQGSQYVNMFKDVAENWPQFRTQVTMVDTAGVKICGEKPRQCCIQGKSTIKSQRKIKRL